MRRPSDQPLCTCQANTLADMCGTHLRQCMMYGLISLPCLECGREWWFTLDSNEANRVFNVFCTGGECEDRYAAKQ